MSKRIINRFPDRGVAAALALLPFLLLLLAYAFASHARLAINADDKLLPSMASLADAISRAALEPSKRNGELMLWADTAASMVRLLIGLGVAALLALASGLATGMVPYIRATFAPFVRVLSMVPPMAILPILFIAFGLGELSKVVLIVLGIAPCMMRDLQQRVMELPSEQIIKAQTLGAHSGQILWRVVLPQTLPRLIDSLRLNLGPAFLFLIAAEAIAAESGLGYRIFLVRRYLAMDTILPYVIWITMLAFSMDLLLRALSRWAFPWFHQGKESA
ncbi:MAG TPA: ABC transporter permease subunit [Solimonas sp.]|nr:ABC transporter permease subunit [Solimonas sp.]